MTVFWWILGGLAILFLILCLINEITDGALGGRE